MVFYIRRYLSFYIAIELLLIIILISIIAYKVLIERQVNITSIKKTDVIYSASNSADFEHYYEPKPNTLDSGEEKWLSFVPHYSINSDTLNEVKTYSQKKQNSVFRMVALGDSFTFGQYVNTKDNWTELLEVDLKKRCPKTAFEVINLGVYGYDLAFSFYRYEKRGEKYNPDLILFLLKEDDFDEIKNITAEAKWDFIDNFKKDPQNAEALKRELIEKELNRMAALEGEAFLRKYYSESEVIDYQLRYLQRLVDMRRTLLVFNIFNFPPEIEKRIEAMMKKTPHALFETKKLQINELRNPPYNYLPYDSHATVKGNILIKERLMDYLIQNNLIPCKK